MLSRRAGDPPAAGIRWESSANGEFTIESQERTQRGTTVILHLKPEAREFADPWRLRALVRRYSDHIAFPVLPAQRRRLARVRGANQAQALWTRPRAEISDDEYRAFYRHVSHDGADPLIWSHNRVEGKREYTSLLYVPAQAPFDLWHREAARGLKLYVRRVFIMDNAEQFLPLYLRFIRGVVDSSDLPLNVSRELLQQDEQVEAMRSALTRRVLELLARLAGEDAARYAGFWKQFGRVIKEGLVEDPGNRERILPLLRYASTAGAGDEESTSLADYVARMKPGQERIYYVVGDTPAAARGSPHIERLRELGVEVLLMGDRVDEWVMGQLAEYSRQALQGCGARRSRAGHAGRRRRPGARRGGAQGEQGPAAALQGSARRAGARSAAQHAAAGFAGLPGARRGRAFRIDAAPAAGPGPGGAGGRGDAGAQRRTSAGEVPRQPARRREFRRPGAGAIRSGAAERIRPAGAARGILPPAQQPAGASGGGTLKLPGGRP